MISPVEEVNKTCSKVAFVVVTCFLHGDAGAMQDFPLCAKRLGRRIALE